MSETAALVWICSGLAVLNVFQSIFWGRQVQRLIDKIMSRNYAEFVQTEQLLSPRPKIEPQLGKTPDEIVDDQAVLTELNGLFGL